MSDKSERMSNECEPQKYCEGCGIEIEVTAGLSVNLYPWCEKCWGKLLDEIFPEFAPHYEE